MDKFVERLKRVFERAKNIITGPKEALDAVKLEEMTVADTMKEYVTVIAAVPAIAQFIGYAIIGLPLIGRYSFGRTLLYCAISYILTILGVFILGKIINALAGSFGAVKNDLSAFKLAVYSLTPAMVAGAFNIIPSLSVLALVGGLYGIYILYLGIPVLMEAPQEKTVVYTVVTVIVAFVVMVIIGTIAGAIAWGGGGMPARYY
jgi:hypothetical protein